MDVAFLVANAISAGFATRHAADPINGMFDFRRPLQLKTEGFVTKGATDAFPEEDIPSIVSDILLLMEDATPLVSIDPQLSARY